MAHPGLSKGVSILATHTLRSNKIAESAELLSMLIDVELASCFEWKNYLQSAIWRTVS